MFQEEKIKDEIQQLNADIQVQDAYIVHRQTEIADLESVISHYCETFNQLKSQRDKLQDERKYGFFEVFGFFIDLQQ